MKATRRSLEVFLEFHDIEDVEASLLKIIQEIRSGIKYNREMHKSSICEWIVKNPFPEDYREEVINGKICLVYPSKMNKRK